MGPDARFFEYALTVLNAGRSPEDRIRPADCLMVGDSLTADIAGAAAFGMHTCWYTPDAAPCPEGFAPTFTVTSPAQVAALL